MSSNTDPKKKQEYERRYTIEHREEIATRKHNQYKGTSDAKEKAKLKSREWRAAHPGYKSEYDKAHPERNKNRKLQSLYGITLIDYNKMLAAQAGVCAVCGKPSDKVLRVDHNHDTGKVRGLLCITCNSMIGMAHDDIQILGAAIRYLGRI